VLRELPGLVAGVVAGPSRAFANVVESSTSGLSLPDCTGDVLGRVSRSGRGSAMGQMPHVPRRILYGRA
jgi:hypothetical protein